MVRLLPHRRRGAQLETRIFPVIKWINALLAAGSVVLASSWVFIAFAGGRMAWIGYQTRGGVLTGFLWLFILAPFGATVLYCWSALLVMIPLAAINDGIRATRARRVARPTHRATSTRSSRRHASSPAP